MRGAAPALGLLGGACTADLDSLWAAWVSGIGLYLWGLLSPQSFQYTLDNSSPFLLQASSALALAAKGCQGLHWELMPQLGPPLEDLCSSMGEKLQRV